MCNSIAIHGFKLALYNNDFHNWCSHYPYIILSLTCFSGAKTQRTQWKPPSIDCLVLAVDQFKCQLVLSCLVRVMVCPTYNAKSLYPYQKDSNKRNPNYFNLGFKIFNLEKKLKYGKNCHLNMRGPSYLGLTRSISWLLLSWRRKEPWYWLCRIGRFLSYLRKDFNYLCRINVKKWH